ncbi:hypothetical protein GCM10027360_92240 [Amycolatopsis echigonensis]
MRFAASTGLSPPAAGGGEVGGEGGSVLTTSGYVAGERAASGEIPELQARDAVREGLLPGI